MKYITLLIISIVAVFVVMLGLSFFMPSHIKISRAINLNANQGSVLHNINDLGKWKTWYPGLDSVPLTNLQYEGQRVISATANGVLLKIISAGDSAVTASMQKGKRPIRISWNLISYAHVDSLSLQQFMEFDLPWYPWEKMSGLLFEKTYGSVMEQGLVNLKNIGNK